MPDAIWIAFCSHYFQCKTKISILFEKNNCILYFDPHFLLSSLSDIYLD